MNNPIDKLLTVSIAAFNMHDYLRQCLDSCLCKDLMDTLEVIIIDDGSKDDTSSIAQEYVDRFPNTFRLIRKENGGYGSTVNISMQEARGKYFRLLDADDWFESGNLEVFLKRLKKCNADLVITPMFRCVEDRNPVLEKETYGLLEEESLELSRLPNNFYVSMWRLTVKTERLKEIPFLLPSHCIFTDQLFTVNCLARAKNMKLMNVPLYCYRMGRDGQSIAPASRLAHLGEIERVTFDELILYKSLQDKVIQDALLGTISIHYATLLKTMVMAPRSRSNFLKIRYLDRLIKMYCPNIYRASAECRKLTGVLRRCLYFAYWPLTLIDLKQQKYWQVQ